MSAAASALKHERIAKLLGDEIRGGQYERGGRLPGEATLAERFSVSRNTVRAALSELGRAGLISTRSGKGSFVTYDGRPLNVRLGWARALEEQGVDTRVDVLSVGEIDDRELADDLGEASARFIAIDRLRSIVDGPIISYERSRIQATEPMRAAVSSESAAGSLTRLLISGGLLAASGQQWVEVRRLGDADAALLERTPDDWFLWSRCVTRTTSGELVEDVESLLDPEHFRLHFQFSAGE